MSRLTRPSLALLLFAGGCATLVPAPPPDRDASLRLDMGLSALDAGRHTDAYDDLAWVYAHCQGREGGAQAAAAMAALELDPRNRAGRPAVGMALLGDLILDPGTPEWLRPLARTTYTLGLGLGAPPPTAAREQPPPAEPVEAADTVPPFAVPDIFPPADPDTTPVALPDTLPDPAPDSVPVAMPDTVPAALPDTTAAEPDAAEPDTVPATAAEPDEPDVEDAPAPRPQPVQEVGAVSAALAPVYGCGPPLEIAVPSDTTLPVLPGPSLADILEEAEAGLAEAARRADALEAELATARRQLAETRGELDRIRRTLRP